MKDKTRRNYFAANRSKFPAPMFIYAAATNYAGYDQTDGMTTEEGVFSLAIARPATIATIGRPATNANYCLSHRG